MTSEKSGKDKKIRVRFAPSPTGPLHIGGIRTALYNYLFAKKYDGKFILRIEDTDQLRFIENAETYIMNSLQWLGLIPDEGPGFGGEYGPYRQSERLEVYRSFADRMIENGNAYYAFDTPQELEMMRAKEADRGNQAPKYDASTRVHMKNSLTLSDSQIHSLFESRVPYTVRMLIPLGKPIHFDDRIRGEIDLPANELDDKVLLKTDGFPTYHLANVVDDHLMKITHVIRGEEWLSSTGHHILIYKAFDWEIPSFAHLPLILKPKGQGKLSKRDAGEFDIPVLPLGWEGEEGSFEGFKERGFLPEALLNFLAFLGWNPGTEQEIFSLPALIQAFSLEQISKSGARFDYDKAKWYNNQYLNDCDLSRLVEEIKISVELKGYKSDNKYLKEITGLLRERAYSLVDLLDQGNYFFEKVINYDEKIIRKKWNSDVKEHFRDLTEKIRLVKKFNRDELHRVVSDHLNSNGLKFGDYLPLLRIALTGSGHGPDLFKIMEILNREEVIERLEIAYSRFDMISS